MRPLGYTADFAMRIFTDRRCLEHRVPAGFPELADRLEGVLARFEASDRWSLEAPTGEIDWRAAVLAIHDEEYVGRLEKAVQRGDGIFDSADNPLSPGTWTSARAAVETTLAAAAAMVEGDGAVFSLVRPPGHHAERGFAMGFCYFNTVSVVAEWLIRDHGMERVAIFDFDVHHGNGTQHLFSSRADVLYVSMHQYPFYPGTGAANECGTGDGEGATFNLPLPAGTGDDVYLDLLTETVIPRLESFAPDTLLLSAGFDAYEGDPLGGMRVTEDCFREYGKRLAELADRLCGGRILAVLEGGYNLGELPALVEAHASGLNGA